MLNIQAKEFVPFGGQRCGGATAIVPEDGAAAQCPPAAASPHAQSTSKVPACLNSSTCCGAGDNAAGDGGSAIKPQLSAEAPAFVPRGDLTCRLSPGRSSPTSMTQRGSSSSVSSSIVSGRSAGSDAGTEEPPQRPALAAAPAPNSPATAEGEGRSGGKHRSRRRRGHKGGSAGGNGGDETAAAGGVCYAAEEEAEAYGGGAYVYDMYGNCSLPYVTADCDGGEEADCEGGYYDYPAYDAQLYGYDVTMPYDASAYEQQQLHQQPYSPEQPSFDDAYQLQMQQSYEGVPYPPPLTSPQQELQEPPPYYWDPAACVYVPYGGGYAGAYGGAWGDDDADATYAHYGDAAAADDGGGGAAAAAADAIDLSGMEEGLAALSAPDAQELLELFFPHYAGDALARLLERQGGDLGAAFAELAAMERQLAAEAAPAAAAAGSGGRGGRSGKRSGGGGGGTAGFKLDMEAFPSLGSPAKPSAPCAQRAPPASPPSAAAAAAASSAAEATAAEPAAAAEPTPAPAPSSSAACPAKPDFASLLRAGSAAQRDGQQSSQGTSTAPAASPATGGAGGRQRQPQRQPQQQAVGRAGGAGGAGGAIPWVSTGAAVAGQYAEERAEAGLLARARNAYFQQATQAYLAGNKALARELGRKGRQANEAMKAAHAAAAARIFASRNGGAGGAAARQAPSRRAAQAPPAKPAAAAAARGGAGGAADGEALFVDLHGLHVAEAVAALEAKIEEARAAGYRHLRVCTGTGHHTKGSKTPARLPRAVADTLLAYHLTFRTLQPGLLEAAM